MIIKIEIPDGREPEVVAEYFYYKCLDVPELYKFKVTIEGTDVTKERR